MPQAPNCTRVLGDGSIVFNPRFYDHDFPEIGDINLQINGFEFRGVFLFYKKYFHFFC